MKAASLLIHESQFPEKVRHDLLASLRERRVNHKFHYDSIKQTQKWLALHQTYSPSRNDEDVRTIYEQTFEAAAAKIKSKAVHVIGLGCGGGQKDTRLLKLLKSCGKEVVYKPCDVSPAMVLTARQTALAVLPEKNCFPCVCDLAKVDDLRQFLATRHSSLVTFFGMIPNFEPQEILPKLTAFLRGKDWLLFSANLAPGENYAAGIKEVLPQYDNMATRDWLMTFLLDLGIEKHDGNLRFSIENGGSNLKRIVARFNFKRTRRIEIENRAFTFKAGGTIRIFFSYRCTPKRLRKILANYKLEVCGQWIAASEEEGVFLCRRK